jgi:uncharacterized protein YjbI with pentapeptide repeats
MANDEHVALLKKGVAAWNAWRDENPDIPPDLRGANLKETNLPGANLTGANLTGADLVLANLTEADLKQANLDEADLTSANLTGGDLTGANLPGAKLGWTNLTEADLTGGYLRRANLNVANLTGADLTRANLTMADLTGANLKEANLREADLTRASLREAYLPGANLTGANLVEANLRWADLTGGDLRGADLEFANLVGTDFRSADLTGCRIFGISAWSLCLDGRTKQQNLVITPKDEPAITVDNIEVAQFVYLLLHNEKIRDVIDTVTSKAVLILGRFTDERKAVLDALREELRKRDYLPILFDFDKPASRDITETISLLARMARFVVADITDAKAIPQELNVIVPDLPSVPVQPLLLRDSSEYGMFEHYARYPWVLPLYRYETRDQLIAALGEQVIEPAERMALQLRSGARPIPTLQWKPTD